MSEGDVRGGRGLSSGYIMLMIEFEGVELSFRGVTLSVVSFRSNGETFFFGGLVEVLANHSLGIGTHG